MAVEFGPSLTLGRPQRRDRLTWLWSVIGGLIVVLAAGCSAAPGGGLGKPTSPTRGTPVRQTPMPDLSMVPSASPSVLPEQSAALVVDPAMATIEGHTSAPLWAPDRLIPVASGTSCGPGVPCFLAAQTSVTATAYDVSLWFQFQSMSVNSPGIVHDEATRYANFGAERYPSSSAAASALRATFLSSRGPCAISSPVTVDGSTLSSCGVGELLWTDGQWSFGVSSPNPQAASTMAASILSFTRATSLPPYPGIVLIGGGGDAGTALVQWQVGSALVHAGGHADLTPLGIAAAMVPYSS
jgi:hypothetical protein